MRATAIAFVDWFLTTTRLQYWPVRVRDGIASGARWTLYPWSAYWRGTQEPEMHAALRELGSMAGWSCWDLGAHFGIYSVGMAMRVGAEGQVASFEPNPVSYARLEKHRKMNGLEMMKTFPLAVSDCSGITPFYTYGDVKGTTTHLPYEGEEPGSSTVPIDVETVVLDDLVARGLLRAADFIKVDIEGHAHRALSGALKTLKAKRPALIVAFHSEPEVAGVFGILGPLGYSHRILATMSGSQDAFIGHDVLFMPHRR